MFVLVNRECWTWKGRHSRKHDEAECFRAVLDREEPTLAKRILQDGKTNCQNHCCYYNLVFITIFYNETIISIKQLKSINIFTWWNRRLITQQLHWIETKFFLFLMHQNLIHRRRQHAGKRPKGANWREFNVVHWIEKDATENRHQTQLYVFWRELAVPAPIEEDNYGCRQHFQQLNIKCYFSVF